MFDAHGGRDEYGPYTVLLSWLTLWMGYGGRDEYGPYKGSSLAVPA